MSFTYKDVQEAYLRIKGHVRTTPLEESFFLTSEKRRYFFKLESFQKVKSFKIRGALNKMMTLTDEEIKSGVAAVSSGNHGCSVSYAASILGIKRAKIIVPHNTPQSKTQKIEHFGGEIIPMGSNYDEAHKQGMEYIRANGLTNIDSYYDEPKVYAGNGTISIEILEQNPEIDTIIAPIGGGALVTGIAVAAKAIKPGIRIIGVQTDACPAMIASYKDGVFYEEYPTKESLCESLVGGIGKLSYEMAKDYVDEFFTVKEETIAKAISFMAKEEKYIIEAGSCTAVAAIMEHQKEIGGKNIALVLSGGNIDGSLLTSILRKY